MTEIVESPGKLCEFVCDMRPDWDAGETDRAILAARTAQYDWGRIVLALVGLAVNDEPAATRPGDLWERVRGIGPVRMPGAPLDPAAKAELFATFAAASDAIRHPAATGPLPALREGDDP